MRNERGSILVITLMFILTFTLLGLGSMYLSMVQKERAEKEVLYNRAFWLAEAGIQKTLWEYNHNSCAALFQEGTTTHCTSCLNCGGGNKVLNTQLKFDASTVYGDYDISFDDGNMIVVAKGWYPSRTAANKVSRTIQLDSGSLFKYAAFAQNSITLNNNTLINSYDSNSGAYGGANIQTNGDVGTDGTTANAITIDNNAHVNGDVSTGAGGTVSVGNTPVNGSTTNTNNITLPSVSVPSNLTSLSNSGSITNNTTLAAGNYKYTAISLSNNKTVTFNGTVNLYLTSTTSAVSTGNNFLFVLNAGASVTIYTDGPINLSNNGSVNNGGTPSKFQIFSTYTGNNGVQITNNGSFYGAVYAPGTGVTISNNNGYYGAVVGKTVTLLQNGQIHYDQVLGGTINSNTRKWQEL